jgi:geranylgeranyl diphosphate synthase type I
MGLTQQGVSAERVLRSVEALDLACLSLCEGQYLDLTFQDQLMVTSRAYYDMIRRKSGALTGCAAELGALTSGADDRQCALFGELGTKLGMAWQITQDIADLWGRQGDGATVSNVLNKKKSLPIIHALETADISTKRELGNIYMKRVLEPQDTARIIAILEQANAGQYAAEQARALVDQALETLESAGLSEEQRQSFKPLGQWALDGLDNLSP